MKLPNNNYFVNLQIERENFHLLCISAQYITFRVLGIIQRLETHITGKFSKDHLACSKVLRDDLVRQLSYVRPGTFDVLPT